MGVTKTLELELDEIPDEMYRKMESVVLESLNVFLAPYGLSIFSDGCLNNNKNYDVVDLAKEAVEMNSWNKNDLAEILKKLQEAISVIEKALKINKDRKSHEVLRSDFSGLL